MLEAVLTPLADLHPWEENPRTIDQAQLERLAASMADDPRMLEARPLIALPDGRVIAGNQRLAAAHLLEWERLPVITVELDEEEARKWAIRDNNSFGEWERPALSAMLESMADSTSIDLTTMGFRDDELDELLRSRGTPDPIPPAPPADPPPGRQGPPSSRASLSEIVLLIPKDRKQAFDGQVQALREAWGASTTADVVLRAVEEACAAHDA